MYPQRRHPRGLAPLYTPPKGRFTGKQKIYIHPEHLDYLDPSLPGPPKRRPYSPGKHSPVNAGRQ